MVKAYTDTDVFLSEINQIRDELSVSDEAVSTGRVATIFLDALPAGMYSTVKIEAIRDPDLNLGYIQRMMRTIFINHWKGFQLQKTIQNLKAIKSRIVGVEKMVGRQRCQLLSLPVTTAKTQVTM